MSTRSETKFYILPWRTPCPSLSSVVFAIEVKISLSEQISGNSNLNRNL
jgi:hypothetical protein